ncbi:MAG: glycogen synthase GlgA [Elusimicrobia bacterium]|nr:glycogen synthase GlgA [Elusimicrobiota bacterium]
MKILMAASEAIPFCKTGGLADVVGALAQVFGRRGHQVAVMLPKYREVEAAGLPLEAVPGRFLVPVGDNLERASLFKTRCGKAEAYFVDNPKYFDRNGLYGDSAADYADNDERFLFFSRAALEAAKFIDFRPDVIHCHDWETALIPAYLKLLYHTDAFYARTGTLLTLHNLAYQGLFGKDALFLAGFGWTHFTPERLEYYGGFNFLKAGLVYADRLNTVSPSYAKEIQTSAEFGRGLEGVLRQRSGDLAGILNGIDCEVWDPETDQCLPVRYGRANAAEGKAACKKAMRHECGLAGARGPLIAVISRLDPQKGLDLVQEVLPRIVEAGAQLVVLGANGNGHEFREDFRKAAARFPSAVHLHAGFDEPATRRLYAAADLFLMPSRFEPCGLSQMIAMRYGAVPVVTHTGGLADTVFEADGGRENGFVALQATAEDVWAALQRAIAAYSRGKEWSRRVGVAMSADHSWERSAEAYESLYQAVVSSPAFGRG